MIRSLNFRMILLMVESYDKVCVSVHLGCYKKIPQAEWLINNKFISQSSGALQVQDQGAIMVAFW